MNTSVMGIGACFIFHHCLCYSWIIFSIWFDTIYNIWYKNL